jgi:sigma-E factor negative regulatory protein RseB
MPLARAGCWLPALMLALSQLGWQPQSLAQAAERPADKPVDKAALPADARSWLQRIHNAANGGNYRGTLVFSAGGSMSSSRVWHYCVGEQTFEKLESLDGRQRQVVRHNEEVHTIWPQSRVAVVEKREALPGWQTTPQRVDPRALEQYTVRREGSSRVAGREADVLLLEPRDDRRYAQRLWADRATGLMLRADVLGPDRNVLESAAFSEVEIGVKPQPRNVKQAAARPAADGYRVVRPKQQRVQLEDEGWGYRTSVPGFVLTGCVRRELEASPDNGNGEAKPAVGAAAASDPTAAPVLQAVFSDGLAHVSVFIEPFDERRHRQEMQAHLGATSTVTLRRDGHWFTAVGDAPPGTLRQIAESLQRKR